MPRSSASGTPAATVRQRPRLRSSVVLSLLVLAASAVGARGPGPRRSLDQLVAQRWTTEQGLPQGPVTAILQTRDGYLWVATFGGLARFDGLGFTVFGLPER